MAVELNIFLKKFKHSQTTKVSNKYRIQPNDSVMCGHLFIGFVDFMVKGKFARLYQFNFSLGI